MGDNGAVDERREQAQEFMRVGRFNEALPLLLDVSRARPDDSNTLYLIGQCYRLSGDLAQAIHYLALSVEVKGDDAQVFLALGIALQLSSQLEKAISALAEAIRLEPNYALAYNSLALTQKAMGDLEKALHNYDAGAKALTRTILGEMRNDLNNPIISHRDTRGSVWVEYASFGALYLASMDREVGSIAWLTGEQAIEEERT
jgi:tetratricopeptide (TPR) repeat protein